MDNPIYKRLVLKFSGEALAPGQGRLGIDIDRVDEIAWKVKNIFDMDIEIAVVVGGGNLWRGATGVELGMDQTTADHMGMIGTVINGLALQDSFRRIGVPSRVQTAVEMNTVTEPYIRLKAIRHLEKGRVVIITGGTGNPYFTTDTAAALRAAEIHADILIKATKVNGIYNDNPHVNPKAKRYDRVSYDRVIKEKLHVMDLTAFTLCAENNVPIKVLDLWEEDVSSEGSSRRKIRWDTCELRISGTRGAVRSSPDYLSVGSWCSIC